MSHTQQDNRLVVFQSPSALIAEDKREHLRSPKLKEVDVSVACL